MKCSMLLRKTQSLSLNSTKAMCWNAVRIPARPFIRALDPKNRFFSPLHQSLDPFWSLANEFALPSSLPLISSFNNHMGSVLIDFKETPTSYEIVAEIPGVDKSDIHLALKHNELTISAEKKELKKEEGETFKRTERYFGTVSRTLLLPEDAAGAERVEACYENGILSVTVPKLEIEQRKQQTRQIEIKEKKDGSKQLEEKAASGFDKIEAKAM